MDLISSTYARNNLSKILTDVAEKGKKYILIRESQPQAAIVPYTDILEREKEWQLEFQRLASQSRPFFRKWLKKKKIKAEELEEEDIYEIIDKTAGRSR